MGARTPRWKRKPDERAEHLLKAALRIFAAKGYRATKLEEIAEVAGVSVGTVYYYFQNKEDLLLQAVQGHFRAVFAEAEHGLVDIQGPTSAKLRFVFRHAWREWLSAEFGYVFRLVIGEVGSEFAPLFKTWAVEGPLHGWALVTRLIEEGMRTGEFRPDADAPVLARAVNSGLMLQAVLHVQMNLHALAPMDPHALAPIDPDRLLDSTVEAFLHGLRPLAAVPAPRAPDPEGQP
jgi:AcrR family transcriptional regulator